MRKKNRQMLSEKDAELKKAEQDRENFMKKMKELEFKLKRAQEREDLSVEDMIKSSEGAFELV